MTGWVQGEGPESVAGPGGGVHFPPALINSSVLRDIRLFNILLIVHDTVLRHETISMLLSLVTITYFFEACSFIGLLYSVFYGVSVLIWL